MKQKILIALLKCNTKLYMYNFSTLFYYIYLCYNRLSDKFTLSSPAHHSRPFFYHLCHVLLNFEVTYSAAYNASQSSAYRTLIRASRRLKLFRSRSFLKSSPLIEKFTVQLRSRQSDTEIRRCIICEDFNWWVRHCFYRFLSWRQLPVQSL